MNRLNSGDSTRDTCRPVTVTVELEVVRTKKGLNLKRISLNVLCSRRITMIRNRLVHYKAMLTRARDCKVLPAPLHEQHP